ncbi:MAG: hypothetical protein ACPLSY_03370 [Moorellaceae bacterium]
MYVIKLVALVAGCALILTGAVGLADNAGKRWVNFAVLAGGMVCLLLDVVIS